MTSLQSELRAKQPEHDAIDADISAYLSSGKFIEILGTTNQLRKSAEYNPRSFDYRERK